ncbi:TRADD-N-associated membrane domain-containing protein [Paenibacillus polymyxa]|uniref:TRADD-N-associated membrane domain-containing protein n=1 Tax=Paenibacillus polymyxa TaxID=1406 RepID=UPI00058A15E5|nr:hypothetical protein [Paenibacillus polymyxa]AJE53056.1 hypothetical protein RE92_19465 [Paenibacillus polymyxa]QOH63102.1 hypothetical protein DI243_17515 [Paenibacillus polymyxa]
MEDRETRENIIEEETSTSGNITTFINRIEEGILEAKSQIKKTAKDKKIYFGLSIGLAAPIAAKYFGQFNLNIVVEVVLWVLSILIFIAALGTDSSKFKDELEKLEHRKKFVLQLTNPNYEPTYFDSLVNINIENLSEYYSLVKKHTQKSFILSCTASVSGFVLIVLGLVFQYINSDYENISFLVTSSGIVVELVSGLFFYLYNKTVRQLKDYHDSLLEVQNILLSFKLIEETEQANERLPLITKMIEFLVSKRK